MELKAKIEELLEPLLGNGKYFVHDLQVGNSRVTTKVTVLLDSDTGITIGECAEISRRLGRQLEELNVIENAYTLEVSSPGVDFPLTQPRQYLRQIGRTLKVFLRDDSTRTGRLEAVGEASLSLLEESLRGKQKVLASEPTELFFKDIDHSQVLVSFK
ncbi:MAG: ribosome maturation factor RimP [Cytophagaceae bacterium]|nr:ribosome maturation factor RimP [Cytophagaceae bacterium]